MLNKIRTFVVIFLLATSFVSRADNPTGVPKDTWLSKFKPAAPVAMCDAIMGGSESSKLMKTKNISYEQCLVLISKSLDKCLDKYTTQLPASFTPEEGKKWGSEIGRCSGEDFYNNNLAK